MPELPEVETTRRGLLPHVQGRVVEKVTLRRKDLRWPIPKEISKQLPGEKIFRIERRAKYLLLHTEPGAAMVHLGMTGSLRVLPKNTPAKTHDHVDVLLDSQRIIRFTDPRRFGSWLWQPHGEIHELLQHLGPEPLSEQFNADYLFERSRGKTANVKTFIMDQAIVVGVGNIYAAESLFQAGIDPRRAAGGVSRARYQKLVDAIQAILSYAIERGGTTLRDFINPDSQPGYFEQELLVYGREGEPCKVCGRRLRGEVLGQRATVWCGHCQK
jgi:formamidopyrimidine-DNA glycosylase